MPKMASGDFRLLIVIALLHLPLGILLYNAGNLAILHPILAFTIGLSWAVQRKVRIQRVALAIAYLVGAEVLWRMAHIPIFWEFGKYGSAIIAVVALIRRSRYRIPRLPLFYFIALLPACFLTFIEFDFNTVRNVFSVNMSGPTLLFISCWLFSKVKMTPLLLKQVFFAIIVPLLSVACVTLFYTITADEIQFGSESNLATSGGFGPNQVSAMLGLGAFLTILCFFVFRNRTEESIFFVFAAIFLSAQSVLTFSRGGIYNAAGAVITTLFFAVRSPIDAAKRLAQLATVVLLFLLVIFPLLDDFTGGNLSERFADTGTTRRSDIVESDLEMFLQNPLFGVGVGAAYATRAGILGYKAMSHTEFSRLLSEHGAFGIAAILSMLSMAFINIKRQQTVMGRAVIAGAAVWAVLFMLNAGMRLAAPSFMWGLMFVTLSNRNGIRRLRSSENSRRLISVKS